MRSLLIAAALAAATTVHAAPLSTISGVQVTIGPELQEKAAKDYGTREVNDLARDLQARVSRELEKTGVLAGGRVELVLVDAKPNRPTMQQMGQTPGLSYESYSIGGATIGGQVVSVDGEVTPVSYRWYETDIRQSRLGGAWSDARHAFGRFAYSLGRGDPTPGN